MKSVLDFVNNLWGPLEPSRSRVVVPARKAAEAGGIDSLESILGLLKSLKIRARNFSSWEIVRLTVLTDIYAQSFFA